MSLATSLLPQYESDAMPIKQYLLSGDASKALSLAEAWAARSKDNAEDAEQRVAALMTLAEIKIAVGQPEQAEKIAKDAEVEQAHDLLKAITLALMSSIHIGCENPGDAADKAVKAQHLFKDLALEKGQGFAYLMEAQACEMEAGDAVYWLRTAEKAQKYLQNSGELVLEVDALLQMVSAQMAVCKENKSDVPLSVQSLAKCTLSNAQTRRPGDEACEGKARFNLARCFLSLEVHSMAQDEASEAARMFRHVGDDKRRSNALIVSACAEAKRGGWKRALRTTEKAIAICEDADNPTGKGEALALLDMIDDIRRKDQGMPSRAQEAAQVQKLLDEKKEKARQHQEAQYHQYMQFMMMAQGQQGGAPKQWKMPQQMPMPAAGGGGGGGGAAAPAKAGAIEIKREGGTLQLSAGMDPEVIANKIKTIAKAIVGDDEDIESDTPLMQAGLTSNSAVILRDEISKDIPGVGLPPTLLFDYPSIGAISEFIAEKAG